MAKHKKDSMCPGCYPERDFTGIKRAADRRRGGYAPLPRCPAHRMKMPMVPPGPALGMKR